MTDTPLADEEVRELLDMFSAAESDGFDVDALEMAADRVARLCSALIESRATVSQLEQRVAELEGDAAKVTLYCATCEGAFTGEPEAVLSMLVSGCPNCSSALSNSDPSPTPCGCEGSCPVCRLGEVENHRCDRCGSRFCSQCHATLPRRALTPGPDTGGRRA